MEFVRSKSVTTHLIWFWKIWVAFSNPTLTAKKATSTQIQQSCGKGAHPKGRTVCAYIKKGKTRFVPENLGYFWNPGNFQLGLVGLGTQLLLILLRMCRKMHCRLCNLLDTATCLRRVWMRRSKVWLWDCRMIFWWALVSDVSLCHILFYISSLYLIIT